MAFTGYIEVLSGYYRGCKGLYTNEKGKKIADSSGVKCYAILYRKEKPIFLYEKIDLDFRPIKHWKDNEKWNFIARK